MMDETVSDEGSYTMDSNPVDHDTIPITENSGKDTEVYDKNDYAHVNPVFEGYLDGDSICKPPEGKKKRRRLVKLCVLFNLVLLFALAFGVTGFIAGFLARANTRSKTIEEHYQVTSTPNDDSVVPSTSQLTTDENQITLLNDVFNSDICGTRPVVSEFKTRIIAGGNAQSGSWPWIGSVRALVPPYKREHMCGASLIAPNLAITAAHCFSSIRDLTVEDVIFGTTKPGENSTSAITVKVEKIYLHPDFNTNWGFNDVAVIKLSQSINWTNYVQPVCLNTETNELDSYSTCYVAGWGQTWPTYGGSSNASRPDTLQEAFMTLVNHSLCLEIYSSERAYIALSDVELCVKSPYGLASACYGDSGGPLMCLDDSTKTWRLVGVVNRGPVCNSTAFPVIFARISSNLHFFKTFTKGAAHPGHAGGECEEIPTLCSKFLPYNRTSSGITASVLPFLEEIYKILENSSCRYDYMTVVCGDYFRRCSLDGPVMVPCQEFCESSLKCTDETEWDFDLPYPSCVSFPSAGNNNTKFCSLDSDALCGEQHIQLSPNTAFVLSALKNIGNSNYLISCTWQITAPKRTNIIVKVTFFNEELKNQVLAFGYGKDPRNLTTVIERSTDLKGLPPALLTRHSDVWFRYFLPYSTATHVLDVQLVATYESDLQEACNMLPDCVEDNCFVASWRCDNVIDCPGAIANDEINCPTTETPSSEMPTEGVINHDICGTTPAKLTYQTRIVAGDDAMLGSWPWIGSLRFMVPPAEREHMCGASLIAPDLAVTAAHCVVSYANDLTLKEIKFGTIKPDEDSLSTLSVMVEKTVIHPDYNTRWFFNDVAILKLSEPVTWTDYVRPVCLQTENNEFEIYTTCYIAGWGQTWPPYFSFYGSHPDTLQETFMTLVNQSTCRDKLSEFKGSLSVSDGDICVESPHGLPSACFSDSGGPVMCLDDSAHVWRLVAVVGRGVACNTTNYPNIMPRISSHLNFVNSFTNGVSKPTVECEQVPSPCSQFLPYDHTSKEIQADVLLPYIEDIYTKLENSSCRDDYMAVMCADFFRRCSLDGPVMVPCREFCDNTLNCIIDYAHFRYSAEFASGLYIACSLFPIARNTSSKFCTLGSDARCGEPNLTLQLNEPVILSALDNEYAASSGSLWHQNCIWKITGPQGTNIIVKVIFLSQTINFLYQKHIVAFGYGTDPRNLTTVLMRIFADQKQPPALLTRHNEVWFRYTNKVSSTSHLFDIQLIASNISDLREACDKFTDCNEENCFAAAWRCDGVIDCPGSIPNDEVNCPSTENSLLETSENITIENFTEDIINSDICGTTPVISRYQTRIIAGEDVQSGSWPWIGSIRLLTSSGKHAHLCGASLITPTYAVTAAHCVSHGGDLSLSEIVFGTTEPDGNSSSAVTMVTTRIERVILHPDYNDEYMFNDVAVIKLSEPVAWTDYVRPVCLQRENNEIDMYSKCYIAGWGQTWPIYWSPNATYPNTLQEASMTLVNTSLCQEKFADWMQWHLIVSDLDLCAASPQDGPTSSCYGDSGGPMMCLDDSTQTWWMVGVVSRGADCNTTAYPDIYARISTNIDFFASVTNEGTTPSVECELIPHLCSQFLPYNRSSSGIKDAVLPFVENIYAMLENSSCRVDYMTVFCADFFKQCSLDQPVLAPCEEFCWNADSCLTSEDSHVWIDVPFLHCYSLPSSTNDGQQFCTYNSDARCGEQNIQLQLNKPYMLTALENILSSGYYASCTWQVIAPPATNIIIKIMFLNQYFDYDYEYYALVFGYGTDPKNLTTILERILGQRPLPPALFTNHNEVWIRYYHSYFEDTHVFDVQMVASNASDLQELCDMLPDCSSESCFVDAWRCDTVVDCPGSIPNDEMDCPNTEVPTLETYTEVVATEIVTDIVQDTVEEPMMPNYFHKELRLLDPSLHSLENPISHDREYTETDINSNICGTTPAVSRYQSRIVGGEDATLGAWPWMGSIRKRDPSGDHVCGASLIAPNFAVTAAHCISGYLYYAIGEVQFGTIQEDGNSSVAVKIEQIIPHPDYDSYWNLNDIGILKLSQPVTWTDNVRPICLQTEDNEIDTFTTCYTAGFGVESDYDSPDVLQEAIMTLVNASTCRDRYLTRSLNFPISESEICTVATNGVSTCFCDSGGPLMCWEDSTHVWRLVGMVSRGKVCNTTVYPVIFTRASSHIDFIRSTTNGASSPGVECEQIPSPCSQYLPYNRTGAGIRAAVMPIIEMVYTMLQKTLEERSQPLDDDYYFQNLYLAPDLTLEEASSMLGNSSCLDEFMTFVCAGFFQRCSSDGQRVKPCHGFCEKAKHCLLVYSHYLEVLSNETLRYYGPPATPCQEFPRTAIHNSSQFCVYDADPRCGELNIKLRLGRPFVLRKFDEVSRKFFGRCIWKISAPHGANIIVKFLYLSEDFKSSYKKHMLAVGYGTDHENISTAIMTQFADNQLPPAVLINHEELWLLYENSISQMTHMFDMQLVASHISDLQEACDMLPDCADDSCFVASWQCDNVSDCPGSNPVDEVDCPPTVKPTYEIPTEVITQVVTEIVTENIDDTKQFTEVVSEMATENLEDSEQFLEEQGISNNVVRILDPGQSMENPIQQEQEETGPLINTDICGTSPSAQPNQRIINGNDVTQGKWPWVGSVRKGQGFHDHHCGAVLIAPQWAVTAAHCLKNPTLYEVTVESVVFGDTFLDQHSASHVEVEIGRVYIHPMYNTISSWNDLAILKLAVPVDINDDVRPICLESGENEWDYTTCYTAGWGMQTYLSNVNRTTSLQEAAMDLVDTETCREAWRGYGPFQTALDNEVCFVSVEDGQSPCYGDSGGPLMCLDNNSNKWNLVGTISHVTNCNAGVIPGLATRISRYLPYITSVLSSGEATYQCESIQSPCAEILPYTMTSGGLQTGLNPILESLFSNNASDCLPDYKYFVCAAVYYDCDDDGTVRQPCEAFCKDILASYQCSNFETRWDRFNMLQTCSQFPSSLDIDQKLCQVDNDADCSPDRDIHVSHQERFVLNSIGFPTYRVGYLKCVWIATAPSEAAIMIKFRVLQFQENMEALTIGVGDDSQDRVSILMKSWEMGQVLPSPIFTGSEIVWIRYDTHWPYDKSFKGFSIELWATNATASYLAQSCQNIDPQDNTNVGNVTHGVLTECDLMSCFPSWWRCDNVVDCPNANDEQSCPLLSNGERYLDQVTEEVLPEEIRTTVATEVYTEEIRTTDATIPKEATSESKLNILTTTTLVESISDFQYPIRCGLRDITSYSRRIVGGDDAAEGDWPWMVSLQGDSGRHVCGATLLTNQWAITAAHCTEYISMAALGSSSLSLTSGNHIQVNIENVYPYPLYNPSTHEGDFALVKLESSVNFGAHVQPACLGTSTDEVESYTGCSILGWGYLREGGGLPDQLQAATVPLLSPLQCEQYIPEVTDNMLCAGQPIGGVDSCQGDSGGPLLCVDQHDVWNLVGITSFGSGCGRPNSPGVYTRISQYFEYINSTLHHQHNLN